MINSSNEKNSEKQKYSIGIILSYAVLIINCLSGIFFSPYIIQCLGEDEYGLYQLIGAFAGYLSILDMGMASSVTKYVSKYYRQKNFEKQENFLFIMLLYYTLISTIALTMGIVMYFQIENLFSNTLSFEEIIKAKKMFLLLLLSIVVTLYGGVFRGVMNAYECFPQTKGAELVRVIVRIIMIWGVLAYNGDSVGIVIIDTLVNIVFFIYRLMYSFVCLKIKIHFYGIDIKELKDVLFFSFFVFLNMVFDQLNWKIDHTILGLRLSTTAVTIYAIGMNFSNYFMNFSIAIKSLFLPKVMHMEVDGADEHRYTKFMVKTGKWQGYVLFYLYFAFLFLGRQFIGLLMHKDYYESWLSALLVMSGLLVPLLQNAGHPILQAKNKHHIYVIVCLCISILNAVCTWFVVEDYGIIGAAFMTMLSFVLGQGLFLSWYYDKKLGIDMKIFFKRIIRYNLLPSLGAVLEAWILTRILAINNWIEFIMHGIIYSIIYWIGILVVGMDSEDKDLLFSFLKANKKQYRQMEKRNE